MISPKGGCKQSVLWLSWLLLILLALVAIVVEDKILVTIFGLNVSISSIIFFVMGIIIAIFAQVASNIITDKLDRYPKKLFKTHFHADIKYDSKQIGKPLILFVGQIYRGYLFVNIKRVCENLDKIGVRPQINKPLYERRFRKYNAKTNNIALKDREYPPIRILSIKDETPRSEQIFVNDEDDGGCGKWGHYKPPLKIVPDEQLIYAIEIEAVKAWKGFIDYRINTNNGMRVSHHPCEIIPNKEIKNE